MTLTSDQQIAYDEIVKWIGDKRATLSLTGYAGCHIKGQGILMFDGSIKKVEDVVVGDQLMGPDSKPRNVLELCRGIGEMVEVIPVKGKPFIVNKDHILSLQVGRRRPIGNGIHKDNLAGTIVDIKVSDWFNLSVSKKQNNKLFRAGEIEFNNNLELKIEPYFMGILLGDGSFGVSISVTTADNIIVDEIYRQSSLFGLGVTIAHHNNNLSSTYSLIKTADKHNPWVSNILSSIIDEYGLGDIKCGDKFVPFSYKTTSIKNRLQVLAGLIDTDGSYDGSCFDFVSKSKQLSEDVAFLSRSLGLAAYITMCWKTDQNGHGGWYHRVCISGDINKIPVRLSHKKARARRQKKSVLRTGISIKDLEIRDEYFGFILDGDHRYLIDDFTVTHNSGKTWLLSHLKNKFPNTTRFTSMTGRAAHRLSELAGVKATTLHSALYRQPETTKYGELKFNKLNEPSCRYLIIDEASMVSPKIYDDLKYWIGCGVKILFVGDDFQLPCILSDEDKKAGYDADFSIFSLVKGPKLTQIMRNTDNIIKVASAVRNNGSISRKNTDDYKFSFSNSLIPDTINNYLADKDDAVIITWRNQVRMALNREIRKRLGFKNDLPEKGEPIFICRNSISGGVLNGEIKVVKNIFSGNKVGELNTFRLLTDDNKYLLVSVEGRDEYMDGGLPFIKDYKKYMKEVRKLKEEVIPISYGYCATVHKIQGSQARKVIVALYKDELEGRVFSANSRLSNGEIVPFSYRFIYTACTRAEKELHILIGA